MSGVEATSPLEQAAIDYVWACRSAVDADSFRLAEAQAQVAVTFHDLQVIAAGDCAICEAGTCPGQIGSVCDTPDLQHYRPRGEAGQLAWSL